MVDFERREDADQFDDFVNAETLGTPSRGEEISITALLSRITNLEEVTQTLRNSLWRQESQIQDTRFKVDSMLLLIEQIRVAVAAEVADNKLRRDGHRP